MKNVTHAESFVFSSVTSCNFLFEITMIYDGHDVTVSNKITCVGNNEQLQIKTF